MLSLASLSLLLTSSANTGIIVSAFKSNEVFFLCFFSVACFFVYQKGDIVKDPMKSIPFLPKIVPGVGWGRVGGSCKGGVGWGRVGHARVGVGWVMQGWGGVGHAKVGWGGVGHAGVGWGGSCKGGVGWGGPCRGGVGGPCRVGGGVGCHAGLGWGGWVM